MMKKLITLLLVGVMLFGSIGSVFAQEREIEKEPFMKPLKEPKVNYIKEFKDELHQINELEIEKLELKIQTTEKRDILLDLVLDAREDGNKEALQAGKEIKEQLNVINQDIRNIQEQVFSERKAFNEAIKNKDLEVAKKHIDQVIALKSLINSKLENKIELLNEMIDIFRG